MTDYVTHSSTLARTCLALIAVAGCGGGGSSTFVPTPADMTVVCAEPQTRCGDACANLMTDAKNCGACGMTCKQGDFCDKGKCALFCTPGMTACGQSCVNLTNDNENCGTCAMACPGGNVCSMGKCAVSCQVGLSICGGQCVNLMTDNTQCGGCGMACAPGSMCSMGKCALSCQMGLTDCSGQCVSFMTDNGNCGGCGMACPMGNLCVAGKCALTCQVGLTDCGGTCVNLLTDDANCGGCGMACPMGNVCSMGKCGLACQQGLANCNGTCVNTKTDNANCGTCGMACPMGTACSGGTCAPTCQQGLALCGQSCVDTRFDPAHCGGCGAACPARANAVAICVNGACGFTCNAGFADCNQQPGDGCEVNLMSNVNSCGACGGACPARSNAVPTCGNGTCGIACNAGYADCNNNPGDGCEINTATNLNHCGACGLMCPTRSNATAVCGNGACGFTCNAGFADCNNNPADGCEINTQNNVNNCGGCGKACAVNQQCAGGVCQAIFTDYGPSHTFAGLTSTHYITQGCCAVGCNPNPATDAAYFCTHFYGQRLGKTCTPLSYQAGTTSSPTDAKMHKNGGCTSQGSDIPNTVCDPNVTTACKIGNWSESTSGLNNIICRCQ